MTRGLRSPAVLVLLAAAMAAVATMPRAYADGGGSIYSRFGLGDVRYSGATQIFGLGGSGAAFYPGYTVNDINPAAWTGIKSVRFSVSGLHEAFNMDDGASSVVLAKTTFSEFSFALPLDRGLGFTFGAGVTPVTRVNYLAVESEVQSGLAYQLRHEGTGGITKAFGGLSFGLTSQIDIAATFDYYFGTNRHILKQDFLSGGFSDATQTRSASITGFGSTVGVIWRGLTRILPLPFRHVLNVGGSLSTTVYPTVSPQEIYVYGSVFGVVPPDTLTFPDYSTTLPFALTAGFNYDTQGLFVLADVRFQKWSDAPVGDNPDFEYRDGTRVSLGVEWGRDPSTESIMTRNTAFRAGVYYDRTPWVVKGTGIDELGLSLGVSVPIVRETSFTLGASYAQRGTTDNGLQKEQILRISFSLDVTEHWFQRPPEE